MECRYTMHSALSVLAELGAEAFREELLLVEPSAPSYDDDFVTLVVPETRRVRL